MSIQPSVGDTTLDRARDLARQALAQWRGGDPDHALDACEQALALLMPAGPSESLADVLRWKGSVYRDRGEFPAAQELYAQSLAVATAISYDIGRAHALNCLGTVEQYRGDLAKAEERYAEAAHLARRLDDRKLSGMIQQNLGVLADLQGRTDEAIAHLRLALSAFEHEGQGDAALWVLNNMGVLHTREGAFARALDALDRARSLAFDLGDLASEGIVEENRAALFAAMGRLEAAELAATRAYGIAEQRRDNARRAGALRAFARVTEARVPCSPQTRTLLERALALAELSEDVVVRVEVLSDLAEACRASGDAPRAKEHGRHALELARRAGLTGMTAKLQKRLRSAGGRDSGQTSQTTAP